MRTTRTTRTLSASLAIGSLLALFLPGRAWLLALALGILSIGCGLALYKGRGPAQLRLTGALVAFVGGTATFIAVTKVALTLVAIRELSAMLGD